MKDYNEIANSVFQRREEYLKEKKRKKALILRNATIALSCCIMIAVGIGIWNIGLLKDIKPSPHKEDYTLPSPNVTTAVTTSDEDITTENTVATAANDILETTAIVSDNSAQSGESGTKTTSANGHSGSGNVTTSRSDSKTSESNVRTTASSIEITSSNNSSHQNLTTSHHQSPVLTTLRSDVRTTTTTPRISTRTTTRRTSTTTRRTSTTTRRTSTTTRRTSTTTRIPVATTTTKAQTRPVMSTTRIYTYSPVATSTTAVYTTRPVYSSMTSVMTSIVYTQPAYTYSPVATSTTASHSSAQPVYTSTTPTPVLSTTHTDPPHSKFYYNSTTYTVAGCENFDTSFTGDLLHRSGIYDVALGRITIYTVYAYKDFSPDFLCMVEFDDGETFLGINWDYVPDNLGEFLDAIDFPDSFNLYYLYDSVNSKYINSPDCTPLTEFLKSNKNAGIIQIIDDFYHRTKVEFDYDMLSTGDDYTCIFGHVSISADQTLVIFMADDYGHRTYEFNVDSTTLDKLYASLQKNV